MSGKPVVEMSGISKGFLGVLANDDVSVVIREGEICALLGENGAGKTTLMNILFGFYLPDSGEISVNGKKISFFSPKDAIDNGIAMVHQHFTLVPSQTVLENVVVGHRDNPFILDLKRSREKLMELEERFGLRVDPNAMVRNLSIGGQQKVEILKALYRNARILILDEPTAVLSPPETFDLFKTLRILVSEGRSIVFISHKLNEVMEIADRILIMRNGGITDERTASETDARELANLMIGREMSARRRTRERASGEILLELRDLRVDGDMGLEAVRGVNMKVRAGSVTGVAGVSGNGQMELAEAIFGIRRQSSGEIVMDGEELPAGNPLSRVSSGMARIPEDRISTGLLSDLSVEENLILENHRTFLKSGILDYSSIASYCDGLIAEFGVKTSGRGARAHTLSGGNLQKLILARELRKDTKVIVAAQPTRGLDVGAIEFVHGRILDARDSGAAVLLFSEDLDEVFELSDVIAVMYEGRIMGELTSEEATRETVGLWMSGVAEL
ncbi:MAG: ABC transporter ATP-binding protein [Synergistaceae bacterium]|jgi:simple sugar transport system ATP-binding protein|nr:ABC transporter ATP-binding protein [Synergistaceae bacterium]